MGVVKISPIHDRPKATIEYIKNPDKTLNGELVSGVNCLIDTELANKKMEYFRKRYCTNQGVKMLHVIHSFSNRENISEELATRISLQWYKKVFPKDAICIAATHIKNSQNELGENCLHTHFAVNNVTRSGKRLRCDKEWIRYAISVSNELCKKYNLQYSFIKSEKKQPSKSWYEWNKSKLGQSWKDKIRNDIDKLILLNDSVEGLYEGLRKNGYIISIDGKYPTLKPAGKKRYVRFKTLGYYYSEDQIENRINRAININGREYINTFEDYDVFRFKHKKNTIGNAIELAIAILSTKLNLANNKALIYTKKDRKAEQKLKVLEESLLLIDKLQVDHPEQCIKIINEMDDRINKINNALTKLSLINQYEKLLKEQDERLMKVLKEKEEAEKRKSDSEKILKEYDEAREIEKKNDNKKKESIDKER